MNTSPSQDRLQPERELEAFAQVGLEADRIVEAVGLQAPAPAGAPPRPTSRKEIVKPFLAP